MTSAKLNLNLKASYHYFCFQLACVPFFFFILWLMQSIRGFWLILACLLVCLHAYKAYFDYVTVKCRSLNVVLDQNILKIQCDSDAVDYRVHSVFFTPWFCCFNLRYFNGILFGLIRSTSSKNYCCINWFLNYVKIA